MTFASATAARQAAPSKPSPVSRLHLRASRAASWRRLPMQGLAGSRSVARKASAGEPPSGEPEEAPKPKRPNEPEEPAEKAEIVSTPEIDTTMSVEDIKAALLDSMFGTERGLKASGEARAEINELLSQLEARNPTPSPNEAMDMLDGEWKLVYTSNSELMALLATNNLPLVTVGDITQSIDGATKTVVNKVQVTVPFSTTTVSTQAAIEVRSPKRLQVKFNQGTISTPTITDSLEIPSSVNFLGQTLDLKQLQDAVKPLEQNLAGVTGQLQNLLDQTPGITFPIQGEQAQTWLITTYLDADTRVSRGDGGSVFVLVKDVSFS